MRPQRNRERPRCQQNDFLLKQLRKDSISFAPENFNPNAFNKVIDSKETILSCNMIYSFQFCLSQHMERISNQALAECFLKIKIIFYLRIIFYLSCHLLDWHHQRIKKLQNFLVFFFISAPLKRSTFIFILLYIPHAYTTSTISIDTILSRHKRNEKYKYSDNSFLTH